MLWKPYCIEQLRANAVERGRKERGGRRGERNVGKCRRGTESQTAEMKRVFFRNVASGVVGGESGTGSEPSAQRVPLNHKRLTSEFHYNSRWQSFCSLRTN